MHFFGRSTCDHTPHENCQTCLTGLSQAQVKNRISHPSSIMKCFNYKTKGESKAQSVLVLIQSMQVYDSSICSLKRNISQNRPPQPRYSGFLIPFDFYKTCIGRHFIIILRFFFVVFFLHNIGSLFLLCSQYLKREKFNTQFQQATKENKKQKKTTTNKIPNPPQSPPFRQRQKINISADDRQVSVNSSYETQENRY